MTENIQFKIGSSFSGEGFDKVNAAIKNNQKELQSSIRGLGGVKTAIAEISPTAGKATAAVSTFATAFVTGGVVGGFIALALKGVELGVSYVADKLKEAKERAEKFATIMKDEVLAALGNATKSFTSLRDEISQANAETNDLLKVLNGQAAQEAANKAHQVRMEMLENLDKAVDDNTKAIIEATGNYKIALIKAEEKQTEANNAVEAYREKVENAGELKEAATKRVSEAEDKLTELNDQCGEYLRKRQQALDYLATEEDRLKEKTVSTAEVVKARRDVALKLKELEEEYKDDVARLKTATEAVEAAKKDAAEADKACKDADNALTAAIQARERATNELAETEKEGALKVKEAHEKQAAAEKDLAEKEQDAADSWSNFISEQISKLNDATGDLSESMDDAGESLENWADGLEEGESETGKDGKKKKKALKVEIANENGLNVNLNGIDEEVKKPKKLEQEVFDRIKNGTASIADWQRFNRFTEREERDKTSSQHRIGYDAVQFIRNADKPESWLSERDKQFQEEFKTRILPTMPAEKAYETLVNAGDHVLTTEKMEKLLGDKGTIMMWLKELGCK